MEEEIENKVINNWLKINSSIGRLSFANLLQGIGNIALIVMVITLYSRPPIVALTNGADTVFHSGSSESAQIKKGTIERHVKKYVRLRYKWDQLDEKTITMGVRHLTTDGFNRKILEELKGLKNQFKGTLSQSITEINVSVTKTQTLAKFDRVLRVNGIPLLIPTEISFDLVKGSRHTFNPSGLEINGVTIHESR